MLQIFDSVRVSLKWHLEKLFHRHLVPLEDVSDGRQAYSIVVTSILKLSNDCLLLSLNPLASCCSCHSIVVVIFLLEVFF